MPLAYSGPGLKDHGRQRPIPKMPAPPFDTYIVVCSAGQLLKMALRSWAKAMIGVEVFDRAVLGVDRRNGVDRWAKIQALPLTQACHKAGCMSCRNFQKPTASSAIDSICQCPCSPHVFMQAVNGGA